MWSAAFAALANAPAASAATSAAPRAPVLMLETNAMQSPDDARAIIAALKKPRKPDSEARQKDGRRDPSMR
jgi:hypothetical protein